jgi:osmotically-inducible protein OsmY
MNSQRQRTVLAIALALAILCLSSGSAQNNAVNLTSKFLKGGIRIDHLLVYSLSGIVVLRGSTSNRERSLQAYRYARKLGYKRIANLIQITPPPDDAAIIRSAERQLDMERALGGCRFHIDCKLGVVHLTGRIQRDMQRDIAIRTVARIDGVREVHAAVVDDSARPPQAPRRPK